MVGGCDRRCRDDAVIKVIQNTLSIVHQFGVKHYAIYSIFHEFKSTSVSSSVAEFRNPGNLSDTWRRHWKVVEVELCLSAAAAAAAAVEKSVRREIYIVNAAV